MSGHTIECPCGTVLRGAEKLACGDVVARCDGVVTGETENEVLAAAAEHAASAHGMTEVPDEVVAAIRAGITEA